MEQRLLTPKEAADRLRVSHDTIIRMINRGELPAIHLSQRIIRIPLPAVARLESGVPVVSRSVVRRRVGKGIEFGAAEIEPAREAVAG